MAAANIHPLTSPDLPTRLIEETSELKALCRQWRELPELGIDTEFFRENTYHPIPALIQAAEADTCWLVDPLGIDDLTPLFDLLADERVVKVMHAPAQDLELFRLMGCTHLRSLYDTQTAAILAGLGPGPGYQTLVAELLDVQLAKTETRSDWRRRPLSESQRHYAAQDVEYLLPLKAELDRRLDELGRTAWQAEECDRLVEQAWSPDDGAGLRKLRQAWRLDPPSQELLRRLWLWRERRARELDRPRQRVAKDAVLQQIAREFPEGSGDLSRMGLPPGWIRRFGKEVLDIATEINALPADRIEASFPPPVNRGPAANRFDRLRKKVSQVAEKLNVPASFLVNRQTLEALALDPPAGDDLPPGLQGWRESVVGAELLETLRQASGTGTEG